MFTKKSQRHESHQWAFSSTRLYGWSAQKELDSKRHYETYPEQHRTHHGGDAIFDIVYGSYRSAVVENITRAIQPRPPQQGLCCERTGFAIIEGDLYHLVANNRQPLSFLLDTKRPYFFHAHNSAVLTKMLRQK